MANHCFNTILVKGEKDNISIFLLHLFKHYTRNEEEGNGTEYILSEIPIKEIVQYELIGVGNLDPLTIIEENNEYICKEYDDMFKNFNSVLKDIDYEKKASQTANDFAFMMNENGDLNINFITKWDPIEMVVKIIACEYPELEFEYLYDEGGNSIAGLYKYKDGKCIFGINAESIETHDNEDPYRKVMRDYLEEYYLTCTECSAMYDEGEVSEDDFIECEECNNTLFWYMDGGKKKTLDLSKDDKDKIPF